MNGIHDMGGMQDMGPIQYEKGQPVFHAAWESRVLAMVLASFAWHKWSLDAFRHTREVMPPEDYLRLSYYEQWFSGLRDLLVRRGLVTAAEIESGAPAPGAAKAIPPLTADKVEPVVLSTRIHAQRDVPISPRFKRSRISPCEGVGLVSTNSNPSAMRFSRALMVG
jgi:nitrile hydratase